MRHKIRVVTRASRTEFAGQLPDGTLRVRLTAPPVDGAANEELRAFLAKECNVPKQKIILRKGLKSKNKIVEVMP